MGGSSGSLTASREREVSHDQDQRDGAVLNGLDLFSGIGGLTLALAPWVRPIAYCENDRYAQSVLLSRMHDGLIPGCPIWDDVRTLRADALPVVPDIVYGGFPCQDISVAGRGAGLGGERSGLVSEVFRLVGELRPGFVFLENVPAIRTRGADVVTGELARLGYDARWTVVSAEEVGAPHLRKRWFCLAADPERIKLWNEQGRGSRTHWKRAPVATDTSQERGSADADSLRKLQPSGTVAELWGWACDSSWWGAEPDVERVVYGVPFGNDRTRSLGNAVVPAQAREAFMRLSGLKEPRTSERAT